MSKLILFWHRKDLRISDNIGLAKARQKSSKVVGIFCFDSNILEQNDIAPVRIAYLIGCLQELQQTYQKLGSNLLFIQGEPSHIIPQLAAVLDAEAVFWNLDVEPYSQRRDEQVIQALKEQGIKTQTYWDQLLHYPGEIVTKSGEPYKVYTPFWKNWELQSKDSITNNLESLEGLTQTELQQAKNVNIIDLPTVQELGYRWDYPLILSPGETAAAERLDYFCDAAINEYQEQRNFPAIEGTSQLSPALKFGVIGIRTVWQATLKAMENSRSDEVRESIVTWQKELAWREFYQHCLYFFPELAEGPYREDFQDFPWDNNEVLFQAWCEGKTGYPIVDAAMRQLNETGWMHNRCRMIVASFLTKDLMINWQWGEKYFMQTLIDGDLAANNGGWQWSASSGMDPKPLRIFNPASQAQKFDPDADYIRQWLPELRSLDTEVLVTGKISPLDCLSCGYPQPIVNHNQQQREFKRRYSQVKQTKSVNT
ncbi:Deoxyribodipyrimidine photo-lyase [Rippkaea orientalis PCC 8801]|uniref:Deoxyribodipyrimidine photo-lyase n=1 Tax=Rippkaea orientalis (strain PCC 8801 / RF-1) TaxID=41431 RepID=B7K4N3_RIPO1|nr:FAD-binding domain-containing protein [Rippkaea orientalis]ACK65498.1 Deoxyribodipyrimidine photo-lyase [Rippkaea orientalis PCC 8801]